MENRETARMRKYGESKTTRIMMATVPHVTSGFGLRKFQADGFLLTRVYNVTFRRVRAIVVVAVEEQYVLHILTVSVAIRIQHEMRMRNIFICGIPNSRIFFHVISQMVRFFEKKVIEH